VTVTSPRKLLAARAGVVVVRRHALQNVTLKTRRVRVLYRCINIDGTACLFQSTISDQPPPALSTQLASLWQQRPVPAGREVLRSWRARPLVFCGENTLLSPQTDPATGGTLNDPLAPDFAGFDLTAVVRSCVRTRACTRATHQIQ
jgi:hypothetical protein